MSLPASSHRLATSSSMISPHFTHTKGIHLISSPTATRSLESCTRKAYRRGVSKRTRDAIDCVPLLVRTGASAQVKNKKARVIKYLEERAEEISQGIGYLHLGTVEGSRAEAKLVLIKLIKVMVENDGRLSGR